MNRFYDIHLRCILVFNIVFTLSLHQKWLIENYRLKLCVVGGAVKLSKWCIHLIDLSNYFVFSKRKFHFFLCIGLSVMMKEIHLIISLISWTNHCYNIEALSSRFVLGLDPSIAFIHGPLLRAIEFNTFWFGV